jgi:hypothetical protein
MPNFTPAHWWECDLYVVSKAHLATEYEIKLTVSDFNADAKKECEARGFVHEYLCGTAKIERKHDLLEAGSERGPSRFFYVMPTKVREKVVLPPWAGWVEVCRRADGYVWTVQREQGRRLHKSKIDVKIIERIHTTGYWRFWNSRTKLNTEVERHIKRLAHNMKL